MAVASHSNLASLSQVAERAMLRSDPPCFALDLLHRIDAEGAATHPYLARLRAADVAPLAPALADAVHLLAILHGTQPSFAELAENGAGATCPPVVVEWLAQAATAFDADRRWLTQLVLATGPSPLTLGLIQAEQVVRNQRDAMLTLARSDRAACALGAAAALAHEWDTVRAVLAGAATATSLWSRHLPMRAWDEEIVCRDLTRQAMIAAAGTAATRRALTFGAVQLLGLHRALWDLLEARQAASLL